jgi:hypothetical protein
MANLLQSCFSNTMVSCFTTIAFTTAILSPPPLMAVGINLDLGAINFGIKIEKLCEKLKRCIGKGETNKIVDYMFDFKHEVEQYTGKKIDINKQIEQAQREARANGQKIDDRYIKQIKKDFHKEDKRYKHRAAWFVQCAEVNIPYSTVEADMHFNMNYVMAKSTKTGDKDIDVPIPIMVGVTVSLCGLFLVFVPIPLCQTAGFWLINTGVGILGSEALQKWDQYDRDQKMKK